VTRLRLTALLLVAAVAATGCGGDDEPKIPRDDAAELISSLREAKRRLSPLVCGDLNDDSLPKLEAQAQRLPEDSDVRRSVEDGIDHLRTLIEAECTARDEERQDTDTTTEPDTTPETTEPETTEPETTEPETTEPETTPPPTTPPDGDEGDGDNGAGGQPAPSGAVRPQEKRRKKKDRD